MIVEEMGLGRLLAAGPIGGASARLVALAVGGDVRDGGARLAVLTPPGRLLPGGVGVATERPIDVDQTNVSVVVAEALRVKWLRPDGPDATRAAVLAAHLAHVGFPAVPRPVAVAWRRTSTGEVPVAFVEAYLPGALDGWDWCPDAVLAGDESFPARLGALAADLHVALSRSSPAVPSPCGTATARDVTAWRDGAHATIAAALAESAGLDGVAEVLRPRAAALGRIVDDVDVASISGTVVQPVHGDLHVGQVLRWDGGLAIVDFDGNPVVTDAAAAQPAARDLAQLLTSLDHVARVAEKRGGSPGSGHLAPWAHRARAACRAAYGRRLAEAGSRRLLDERLLPLFMIEQECREVLYAARHLARWAYVPATTLRAWLPDVGRDGTTDGTADGSLLPWT